MARMIFVNLPVKDVDVSKQFFTALGFDIDPRFTDADNACVVVSDTIYVMLLSEPKFQGFINDSIADTSSSREVLNCLSCDSRDEVDELLAKAIAAGGKPWQPVHDEGYMYGASFQDPDNHVWELVWMDVEAAMAAGPQQ